MMTVKPSTTSCCKASGSCSKSRNWRFKLAAVGSFFACLLAYNDRTTTIPVVVVEAFSIQQQQQQIHYYSKNSFVLSKLGFSTVPLFSTKFMVESLNDFLDQDDDDDDQFDPKHTRLSYEDPHYNKNNFDHVQNEISEMDESTKSPHEGGSTPEERELVEFLDNVLYENSMEVMNSDDLVLLRAKFRQLLDKCLLEIETQQFRDEKIAQASDEVLRQLIQQSTDRILTTPIRQTSSLLNPEESWDADFLRVICFWEGVLVMDSTTTTPTTFEENFDMERRQQRLNTEALPRVVDRVYELFRFRQTLSESISMDLYEAIIRVLAYSRDSAHRLWTLLKNNIMPEDKTEKIYTTAIPCLAKSRNRGAAQRAEELLREAVEKFPPKFDSLQKNPIGIRVDTFNFVITAWAKSGLDYGPERAEKLIVFMDETDKKHGSLGLVSPNIFSFTSLIDAYAQKGDWEGATQSERILRNLLDQYLAGAEEANDEEGNSIIVPEPSIASWNIVISAWSRLSRKGFRRAADRAGNLLVRMEQLSREGKIGFRPDAIVYVTCMNAYAFSKTNDGPPKAEALLDRLYEFYMEGDESMKPTAKSIRIVIDSWLQSNSTDCLEEAEILLERYEDFLFSLGPPHEPIQVLDEVREIYRTMLLSWAKRGFPVEAQRYLRTMIDKGMKPDSFCYEQVLESNTFSAGNNNSSNSDPTDDSYFRRSQQVMEWLEYQRKSGQVHPNERVYTSFIRVMIRARIPNMARKANVILRHLEDLYWKESEPIRPSDSNNNGIRPTVFTYNAVLMACAETPLGESSSTEEALKIAVQIFNDLRNKNELDHVSFANMLRCATLLPDDDPNKRKDQWVQSTFSLCCKAGFVNDFVLRDFRQSASEEIWRSWISSSRIDDLPPEWSHKFLARKSTSGGRKKGRF